MIIKISGDHYPFFARFFTFKINPLLQELENELLVKILIYRGIVTTSKVKGRFLIKQHDSTLDFSGFHELNEYICNKVLKLFADINAMIQQAVENLKLRLPPKEIDTLDRDKNVLQAACSVIQQEFLENLETYYTKSWGLKEAVTALFFLEQEDLCIHGSLDDESYSRLRQQVRDDTSLDEKSKPPQLYLYDRAYNRQQLFEFSKHMQIKFNYNFIPTRHFFFDLDYTLFIKPARTEEILKLNKYPHLSRVNYSHDCGMDIIFMICLQQIKEIINLILENPNYKFHIITSASYTREFVFGLLSSTYDFPLASLNKSLYINRYDLGGRGIRKGDKLKLLTKIGYVNPRDDVILIDDTLKHIHNAIDNGYRVIHAKPYYSKSKDIICSHIQCEFEYLDHLSNMVMDNSAQVKPSP